MNKMFVFTYTRLDIESGTSIKQHKSISSKELLAAQIQMLMFLNKSNKESKMFKYYAEKLTASEQIVNECGAD